MARRLIWAPEAIIDLNDIVEHIAEDDEILAKQFARQIMDPIGIYRVFHQSRHLEFSYNEQHLST